jgi:hypothetical protein
MSTTFGPPRVGGVGDASDPVVAVLRIWPGPLDSVDLTELHVLEPTVATEFSTRLVRLLPRAPVTPRHIEVLSELMRVMDYLPAGTRPDPKVATDVRVRYLASLDILPPGVRDDIRALVEVVFAWLADPAADDHSAAQIIAMLAPAFVRDAPELSPDPPSGPARVDADVDSYRGEDGDYESVSDSSGGSGGGGGGSDGSTSDGDDAARVFAAQILPSPTEPVQVGKEYGLSIRVEVGPVENQLGTAPVPESLIFRDGSVAEVELTVQLDSPDCKIINKIPRLVVPRTGPSMAAAEFSVVPLHDGPCRLIATMHAAGNFVQQLELTLDVGSATQPQITGAVGRAVDAVSVLRPREIGIVLRRLEGGYLCVVADAKTGSAVLPITDDLLAISVERVRQALLTVVQSTDADGLAPFQRELDIPLETSDAALRTLAVAGGTLFSDLFEPPQQTPGALALGRYLRRAASNPDSLLTIQIASDGIVIPWGLMYVGDTADGAALSWDGFLGLRHVVEQLPVQDTMDDGEDTDILSTPNLRVNVNLNDQIDLKWGTDFVSTQAAYWERSKVSRAGLSVTVGSTLQQLINALQNGGSDQIIYLYCHAAAAGMTGTGDPLDSRLELSDQSVTLAELRQRSPMSSKLAGHPLVFINACESAELSPRFYEGFAPYLIAKGSRGVIGTECRMPALFAADWAQAFFERMLAGMPLGQTMHELRQHYLRDHNNPLGLVYAMHCSADTQITPPIAMTAAD